MSHVLDKAIECPWCKENNLGYSIKTSSAGYHASIYCKNCHCYGPRILLKKEKCYLNRCQIENDTDLFDKALIAWNTRKKE